MRKQAVRGSYLSFTSVYLAPSLEQSRGVSIVSGCMYMHMYLCIRRLMEKGGDPLCLSNQADDAVVYLTEQQMRNTFDPVQL